ncbi:unnamed protein product [Brachionus calyciflorus]|uniref:Uncharacterized protein n=1 Tax=Brachionus calyciflorus TaxID=104777 RepID=A0A814CZI2_9BILA|nr:unnamed protein product [Brachionus calyciflorus]
MWPSKRIYYIICLISWPPDAFIHGVKFVEKKDPKFYVALHNVSTDFDIKDPENLEYLRLEYNIVKANRIVKKSTNEPLKTIKALINNKESNEKIIKSSKLKIGNTIIRAKPWNFGVQPELCFHCQKLRHKKINCPDPKLFNCAKKNHPSCSKNCEILTQEVTESIEENPKYLSNLVYKYFGKNYANYVRNKLFSEIDLNSSDISAPDSLADNDMDFEAIIE